MTSPRVRMTPDSRREQLLELGVRLFATRSLDQLSIETLAEEAGISRGLLYHYFGNKQDFHEAVVRRAADDLFELTAPSTEGDLVSRLASSLDRYLGYVETNLEGYRSLVRAAYGGNEAMREIYESARAALTDRIFLSAGPDGLTPLGLVDTPGVRLMVRGWSALVEDVVLSWVADHRGIERQDLLDSLTATLALTLGVAPTA